MNFRFPSHTVVDESPIVGDLIKIAAVARVKSGHRLLVLHRPSILSSTTKNVVNVMLEFSFLQHYGKPNTSLLITDAASNCLALSLIQTSEGIF
jgi:hypothetical protein